MGSSILSSSTQTPAKSRTPRKRIGELAVEAGLIGKDIVKDALSAQKELNKLGLDEKLGQILLKKKLITLLGKLKER